MTELWYDAPGAHSEIVISTGVSVSRNLSDVPFPHKLSASDAQACNAQIIECIRAEESARAAFDLVEMKTLGQAARTILCRQDIVDEEFARAEGEQALLLSEDQGLAVLLQGEDHICIRSMKTGLSLRECYAEASELDETLCRRLPIAFDSGLGYLTASPYRLGTGLTVYAVLHLPFCEESGVLEAYAPTAKNLGILIERVPGAEWERASAYRVSNRVTLGIREEEAVGNLQAIVEQLMAWERRYSDVKSAKERVRLADRLLRSVGVLRYAKLLECGECYTLLSDFRLAVRLGLLPFEQPQRITGAYYRTSDAVLDGYTEEPDAVKRCMLRARLVQEAVGG